MLYSGCLRHMISKKPSELVEDLTEMWLLWIRFHAISMDHSIDVCIRKKYVDRCEDLILKEAKISKDIDRIFNG
jgi:uncharacterized protein YeeX (DUF496 family)